MATSSLTFSLSLLIIFLLHLTTASHSSSSIQSFLYGGCSQLKYASGDVAYESNLNSLLTSLVNSATYSSYNHFTVLGAAPQDVVYGLYQCRGDLPMPACASCVTHSVSQLGALCPGSCGGALQLDGCFIKYDNDTFVGVEDKAVVLKKCGPPTAIAGGSRDAVLDGLVGGVPGGIYRVGGSKDVQGVAQCVGDLSGAQCQDCLTEAVKQLKVECGMGGGGYGDMFLGKCYVRYKVGGAGSYYGSTNGSDKNRGVKIFALVIGLLAAIVILIIFLTFICRVFGGSSK